MEPDLIESEVFLKLRSKSTMLTLLRFHQKLYRRTVKGKKGIKNLVPTNNGELLFTYSEAKELGMSSKTFWLALRELIQKGFIDIAQPGNPYAKEPTRYAISERWRKYGTMEFKSVELPRQLPKNYGFQPKQK